MMGSSKRYIHSEVTVYLCADHYAHDLSESYPDHKFNCLPSYHHENCEVENCEDVAFYKFIGVKIPDVCPENLYLKNPILAPDELYLEAAKALMDGTALEKLTSFLYFKTRTYVYDSGDFAAVIVVKQLARLLLKELKIEENQRMNARQVTTVLKYLRIYPIDYLEAREKPDQDG